MFFLRYRCNQIWVHSCGMLCNIENKDQSILEGDRHKFTASLGGNTPLMVVFVISLVYVLRFSAMKMI
jgi:hypothetical protein